MCLLVVGWHLKVLGPVPLRLARPGSLTGLTLADLVNLNLLLTAVPSFLLMSAWLLFPRATWANLRRRLVWLVSAYLFWSAVYTLYWRLPLACDPVSVSCIGYKLMTGNGTPVNYYFAVQIVCDLLLFGLVSLPLAPGRLAAKALVLVAAANAVIALAGIWRPAASFFNPLNFVAIPAAVYILRSERWNLTRPMARALLAGLSVALAAIEYKLFLSGGAPDIPPYARPSLLATSLLFLSLMLPISAVPRWLSWAAGLTYGVFCIHFLVIGHLGIEPASAAALANFWAFAQVTTVSALAAVALRFAFRQRLV